MTDQPIWEAIPLTEQRYQHLLEIEKGDIWWDAKWQKYRCARTARGTHAVRPSIDFVRRFGLAYETQKISPAGWFQCGLTTDGQILLAKWREQKRREFRDEFRNSGVGPADASTSSQGDSS
jgi:hypothetical protein